MPDPDSQQPYRAEQIREFVVGLLVLGALLALLLFTLYRRCVASAPAPPAPCTKQNGHAVSHFSHSTGGAAALAPMAMTGTPHDDEQLPVPGAPAELAAVAYVPNPASLQTASAGGSGVCAERTQLAAVPAAADSEVAPVVASLSVRDRSPPGAAAPKGSRQVPDSNEPNGAREENPASVAKASQGGSLPAPDRLPVPEGRGPARINRVERVRAGDSFWSIAQRVYGRGDFFRALYARNRHAFPNPDHLPVGGLVSVPTRRELRQRFPELCPGWDPASRKRDLAVAVAGSDPPQRYVVQPGDTLFDIARFKLGQAARYLEILQLNRDQLGEQAVQLRVGMVLTLPAHDS